LTLSRDGNKIEDIVEVEKEITSFLDATLTKAVSNNLLV